jgi:dTDP-4-amino-4,6-dideoxygalactose transaminase
MKNIAFSKPKTGSRELEYIGQAIAAGKLSGDGPFTQRCQKLLQEQYGFHRVLLTTSCTDALELSALLLDIKPGDEVIVPSFTFVSTANAFALRGAKLVFADSLGDHPNMDCGRLEELITPRTRAVVPVHYAGAACDMDAVMALADRHGLSVVEDAAQAIDGYYKGRPLGSIGHSAAFSFHETKNLSCGEGGAIVVNDEKAAARAEIMREKGTNRSAFFRGEVDKYSWVDLGSSFLPSDILAAYLLAQLESLREIQDHRVALWNRYAANLGDWVGEFGVELQRTPAGATNNAHMFYLVFESLEQRTAVQSHLRSEGISASFHYLSLHTSTYFSGLHDGRPLPNSDRYSDCLLRLPMHGTLTLADVDRVTEALSTALRAHSPRATAPVA